MFNKLYVLCAIWIAQRRLKKATPRRQYLENEYRRYATFGDHTSPQVKSIGDQAKAALEEELLIQTRINALKLRL